MKGTARDPECKYSQEIANILAFYSTKRFKITHVDLPKFHVVNVKIDMLLKRAVKEVSKWQTIPQLFVKGKFVGGHSTVKEMHLDGRLESLFSQAELI